MICRFAEFKPARLFTMTGMSPDLQQLWRRRGQLPWGNEKPRPVTAMEAAEIFLRYQLTLVGVPPSESGDVGRDSAPIIFWYALLNVEGACLVRGPADHVMKFVTMFEESHNIATELTGVSGEFAYRYLVRYNGEGSFIGAHDYPDVDDSDIFSTVLAVSLDRMGTMLATRADGPLLVVDLPDPAVPRKDWITRSTNQFRPTV